MGISPFYIRLFVLLQTLCTVLSRIAKYKENLINLIPGALFVFLSELE
jgi:hypothetical protein